MKAPFRILSAAAAVLLCACTCASAADVAGSVRKMQETYARIDGFRSEFTQKLLQRDSGVTETRTGTILFKKPLLVRWETKAPHSEMLMVTENEVWNYLADEELAYRYPREVAEDSRSLIQVITGQSSLDRDFDLEETRDPADGRLIHLMLYPKDPTTELTEAQLWIDPDTSLIRRVSVMDFYGNLNTVELSGLKTGAAASASDFRFTPPKGTEVEDHVGKKPTEKRPLSN